MLCQALQMKSQDILNVVRFVSSTKKRLQRLRENGWHDFIGSVLLFCERHDIDVPDMNARYMGGTGRSCQQHDYITFEHFYRVTIFITVIDFQLMELDSRFTEQTMELLTLGSCLNPNNGSNHLTLMIFIILPRNFILLILQIQIYFF